MKVKLLSMLLILLLAVPSMAAPPERKPVHSRWSATVDNEQYINVNNILMFVTNHGNFCRDLAGVFGLDAGTFFPYCGIGEIESGLFDDYSLYASGLWIGAVDSATGDTLIAVSEYSDEYVPGPMDSVKSVTGAGTVWTFVTDRPEYKVYKLYSDSLAGNPNDDYTNWPVDQGAPVDDNGDPEMVGDQMLWAVYNDADVDQHDNNSGDTDPLGIEIKQTTFAWDQGALSYIIFVKFQVFNRGGKTLQDCYISLWSDPDLGDHLDDLVGCDTTLSVGYVYNETNDDSHYGSRPPCVGYDFFQGPLINTGDNADTAKMWDTVLVGYQNMSMTSFNKYINGTDPDGYDQTYNYMTGTDQFGNPYVYLGDTLLFMHSGDPVENVGDLDFAAADRRFMLTTGPITFRHGDSTEILAAIVFARGADRLNSIAVMKDIDAFAQDLYENDFNPPAAPARPKVSVSELDGEILLTWGDTSEVDPGDLPFEGYAVYQGATPNGPWTELGNYDLVNDVANLIDTVTEAGVQLPIIIRACKNTGLTYHYRTSTDALTGGRLWNATTYYFMVEAYCFDATLPAGNKYLAKGTVVSVIPQSVGAGISYSATGGDTLAVTHTGTADGSVTPIVLDPSALTGDTYVVIFEEDALLGPVWHLVNETTGDTLLEDQVNQTGNPEYFVADGIMVKVVGPDPGVKPGDEYANPDDTAAWGWYIPNGTRRFTWGGGADGFGWEGFRGGLGWSGPGVVWGGHDPVPAASLPNVLLKLADVDIDGNFTPTDDNVSYAYRYGRGFSNPPALPEFAPFIINPGSYSYQDFEKSCPLSAWNVDVDPPQRLVLGYLENNVAGGLVDGKYWPPYYGDADNTASSGPREWLWIFLADYSETPNADYQLNATDDPMPIMYWATWARRAEVAWVDGDEFMVLPNKVNSAADTFTFVSIAPTQTRSEAALERIKPVPNPYYLFSSYDTSPRDRQIYFQNLPDSCTITIYNLAGDRIATIEHTPDDPDPTLASWNVQTSSNLPVASGIYIYVVDAPGYGQKIGKMAVFTEVEVLDRY